MIEQFKPIELKLKGLLDSERFEHTIGVAHTAACMAMCYGEDVERAYQTGLLHDCGKYYKKDEFVKVCQENNVPISDFEYENPALLHAKLGAHYARTVYGVTDEEIISAIAYHTTGKPGMTVFEQIIYIADYIEPCREVVPHQAEIRKMAFEDLDKCMVMISKNTIDFLVSAGRPIDNITRDTYEYYKAKVEGHE